MRTIDDARPVLPGAVALLPASSALPEYSVVVMRRREAVYDGHVLAPAAGFVAAVLFVASATGALAVLGSRIEGPSRASR